MKKNDIQTEEQFNDLAGMCMGWRMGENLWWYDPELKKVRDSEHDKNGKCFHDYEMFHKNDWVPINDWNQAIMIFDKGCSQLFSERRVFLNDLEGLMKKYNDNTIISPSDDTSFISYPDALMHFTPYNIILAYALSKGFLEE